LSLTNICILMTNLPRVTGNRHLAATPHTVKR
jgi:hypothetical protein